MFKFHTKRKAQLPPQTAMLHALKKVLETDGSFDTAMTALAGFNARTLSDGIQVGTHLSHKTGAVIAPKIAALACADKSVDELTSKVINAAFSDIKGQGLHWDISIEHGALRALAVYPVTSTLNLQITCVDEPVEPYFDGRTYEGATIVMQLIDTPAQTIH
jgi:hypothetical protein